MLKARGPAHPLLAAGSPWCLRCRARLALAEGLLCEACVAGARRRRRGRRMAGVAGRWAGASLLEGLVGVGAGALALFPLAAPPGRAGLGLMIAALLLLIILALGLVFAHGWLLRPVVRRWLLWAALDGAELLIHWLIVLGVVLAAGYQPGLVAAITALTGGGAALLQSRALRGQAPAPWRWALGASLLWLAAAAALLAVELAAPGPFPAIIVGAALGRLLHGLLAAPLLGLILVPPPASRP